MPFLRFSRDKRGYEHTYLVHATNKRGKPVRPRILYWYRTPPGVRLGRVPFPEEVRKAIEAQNPGVVFDWEALASTPFPAQEPEYWRERRKAEKAAKQARREEEALDAAADGESASPDDVENVEQDGDMGNGAEPSEAQRSAAADGATSDDASIAAVTTADAEGVTELPSNDGGATTPGGEGAAPGAPHRKRRRRGGRRRRARLAGQQPGAQSGDAESADGAGAEPSSVQDAGFDPSEAADSASESEE